MFMPARVQVTFVDRGRVRLDHPLMWTTASETITVAQDFVSNGASVPALFWPLVGHPYSGSLLLAALLHDWGIAVRQQSWQRVHRQFYDALRASGVGTIRAWLCYAFVWAFGPRWR